MFFYYFTKQYVIVEKLEDSMKNEETYLKPS